MERNNERHINIMLGYIVWTQNTQRAFFLVRHIQINIEKSPLSNLPCRFHLLDLCEQTHTHTN